ncbi:glycosyltransferase [Streptomyces sp. NBC_00624]|uniref:glycosyltransferase n=1 Tax=Streptomyces sp. NBC_00624 TaxID=2975791 RepID=UPI0030E12838
MRDQIRIIEPWHQGAAQQINTVVRDALPWLLDHADVIHQCGPDNVRACASTRRSCPHKARRAVTSPGTSAAELLDVLALADVVISRGGAGTIAELTALGKRPPHSSHSPRRPKTNRSTTPRTWRPTAPP